MKEKPLKVGDRIHLIRTPPIWEEHGHKVPPETRKLYRKLMARRHPLVIREVNEFGAWIWYRDAYGKGWFSEQSLAIDDGCWVRVKPRTKQRAKIQDAET